MSLAPSGDQFEIKIFSEHDEASFGNNWMCVPVILGPVGAVAGIAGVCSHRAAKTLLPLASATIVANGLQGRWLHSRGIKQKPGGWKNFRYNMEMSPPLMAPLDDYEKFDAATVMPPPRPTVPTSCRTPALKPPARV